jgi:hypothetical protein
LPLLAIELVSTARTCRGSANENRMYVSLGKSQFQQENVSTRRCLSRRPVADERVGSGRAGANEVQGPTSDCPLLRHAPRKRTFG